MAVEWGPDGVRVVGLAPGPIENTVGFSKLGKCRINCYNMELTHIMKLNSLDLLNN